MLALAFARWAKDAGSEVDVLSFRGGSMVDDFVRVCPVRVLLDPNEPWDHGAVDPERAAHISFRASAAGPSPDVLLAVSVAAGQVLPHLSTSDAPLVTWVVEQGADLHWLDVPDSITTATSLWLAGSEGVRSELRSRPGWDQPVRVAAEFIDMVQPPAEVVRHCRRALTPRDEFLVVGAGIATHRKGPDLFIEAAAAYRRLGGTGCFVWIGGESDAAFESLLSETRRLGHPVRFFGNVDDVTPWLAAADVMLHTARLDAFPLVALHAASVGTPVVGFTGVGGLTEMLGDATVGAPYPDITVLVDRLRDLADPVNRTRLGRAQQRRVSTHFSTDVCAPVVMDALRRAADEGSSA
jgi:glycosyltransferase involved in cell wall biosynthesis